MTGQHRPKPDKDRAPAKDDRARREKALDEALSSTFPASDPVAVEQPVPPADEMP
jgi:hypothetical protein